MGARISLTRCLGAVPMRARSAQEPRRAEAGTAGETGVADKGALSPRGPWSGGGFRKGRSRVLVGVFGCRASPLQGSLLSSSLSPPTTSCPSPAPRGPSCPRFPEPSGLGVSRGISGRGLRHGKWPRLPGVGQSAETVGTFPLQTSPPPSWVPCVGPPRGSRLLSCCGASTFQPAPSRSPRPSLVRPGPREQRLERMRPGCCYRVLAGRERKIKPSVFAESPFSDENYPELYRD